MVRLKGITWNHTRGYGPLLAVTKKFYEKHPELEISWDSRSLKDFGDYPVDRLAREYDIILIDHPHVGISSSQGVLLPLDEYIPESFLNDQTRHSVGQSNQSYAWNGHQWALAVDAAAQVSAYREEFMPEGIVPTTWNEVEQLARDLAPDKYIGWPLCPTDAICSFLSLCADIGGDRFFDEKGQGIDPDVGMEALNRIARMLPLLHPESLAFNPIQMLDHMTTSDDIVYVPLLFGYSNYSRPGYVNNTIRFTDIPTQDGYPRGSLLGGVGMAVSSYSNHPDIAVMFVKYTADSDTQQTVYFEGGGQPGHRSAWLNDEVNRRSGNFFINTLQTLDNSYLRPRNVAFPVFQEKAGEMLHYFLHQNQKGTTSSPRETISRLNALYNEAMLIAP